MVITYYGKQCFKLQFGDMVIAFDPASDASKDKSFRFGADVVTTSVRHPDFAGGDLLASGNKEPFVITGPGEYEVQDVFIKGFASKSRYGEEEQVNTIYFFRFEDMDILNLGALENAELPTEVVEAVDNVDILFIPIGGEGVLEPVEAHKLSVKLEANVVIPMNYNDKALGAFLKEEGSEKKKTIDKLTVKPKDVAAMEGEIVVLEPSSS